MHGSKEEVPRAVDTGGVVIRLAEWGGMNVALETFPAGTETEPIFKGLPDDRCQSPHWGYVLKGRVRVRYPDREEVLQRVALILAHTHHACRSGRVSLSAQPSVRVMLGGSITLKSAVAAGDAFYMEPGHTTVFEEDPELVEFSPRDEYRETLEVAQRNVAAMQESGASA